MEQKLRILIAVALGVVAMILTYIYIQKRQPVQVEVPTVPVIVAATDIPQGSEIVPEMLALKDVPREFVQPGALGQGASILGSITAAEIKTGEQILVTKLAAPQRQALTLAQSMPPGKRAVTVSLGSTLSVGGLLKPGNHVDVLATFNQPPITITLFQHVLVLAVGQEIRTPRPAARELSQPPQGPPTTLTVSSNVTLALSPQETKVLTVALEQAKIRLILLPETEAAPALPEVDLSNLPPVVDLDTLLQFYATRVREPGVEVIRGLRREIAPFPPPR